MKHLLFILMSFILLMACQEQQTISASSVEMAEELKGTVTDSLSGKPITNADVFVVMNNHATSGDEKNMRTKTDQNGNFSLQNLSSEVLISVKKKGFKPVFRSHFINPNTDSLVISMNGMPDIFKQFINDLELDYSSNDSSIVILEIRDLYNENKNSTANAFVHFYDLETDVNMGAVELEASFETPTYTTLRGVISANMFPKPSKNKTSTYGYYYEIIDPDNIKIDYGLERKDTLSTLRIL